MEGSGLVSSQRKKEQKEEKKPLDTTLGAVNDVMVVALCVCVSMGQCERNA